MLKALIEGTASPTEMAALAKGKLRRKRDDLIMALEGGVEPHHRFLLTMQLHRLKVESGVPIWWRSLSSLWHSESGPPTRYHRRMCVELIVDRGLSMVSDQQSLKAMARDRAQRPRIRAVQKGDIDTICRLLHYGFASEGGDSARLLPDVWRRLFSYGWLADKPDLGLLLEDDDQVVGFLGKVYSLRHVAGRSGLICGLSSFYVLPKYRGWGLGLLTAAVQDQNVTYTSHTPNRLSRRMLQVLNFVQLEEYKVFLPPFANADTLLKSRPQISVEPGTVRQSLDAGQRRIFDDHSKYDCLQMLIREGPNLAHLVVKRRAFGFGRFRRFIPEKARLPYSEVLYCSKPPLLARHLERVKLTILRQQRTVGIVVDPRLLPAKTHGLALRKPQLYRSSTFEASDIDKLYSEHILLPI
jgi:acetoacetyl-CoA synthetase